MSSSSVLKFRAIITNVCVGPFVGGSAAMAVTITDIAEQVGVAPSTVSRVLNGNGDGWASAETSERIHETARELGYLANPYAQALKSGRSPVVAFIVGSLDNQAEATKAWRLHSVVVDLKREVLSTDISTLQDLHRVEQLLHILRPAAVVWLRPPLSDTACGDLVRSLHDDEAYVLLVDCAETPEDDLPCDALIVRRAGAAYAATRHLIDVGHTRIAMLADPNSNRIPGYEAALDEAGIEWRALAHYRADRTDARMGAEAVRRLMQDHPDFTAIFCHSDLVAIGAIQALNEAGVTIPDDVSVIGFDNDPWTAFLHVPLTTLAHPVGELCEHTVRCLMDRAEERNGPWRRIDLRPELIVRESSASPAD